MPISAEAPSEKFGFSSTKAKNGKKCSTKLALEYNDATEVTSKPYSKGLKKKKKDWI